MKETGRKAFRAIVWTGDALELLDQRKLPHATETVVLTTAAGVADAIRDMVVRGAPAIGIAAAYGLVLEAAAALGSNQDVRRAVQSAAETLLAARPTAVNLRWAVSRMMRMVPPGEPRDPTEWVRRLELEAKAIHEEDVAVNKAIGRHGGPLLAGCRGVLTHCNTGSLATGGYGTALGMIRRAWEDGARFRVYACETRPFFQGARLTVWELDTEGIDVTLLVDSAATSLMAGGDVQAVVVGADRVAADGAVANKIGTHALAVSAMRYGIPFYVAAPISTLDPDTARGQDIVVEHRAADEVRFAGGSLITVPHVAVYNPAFDVTPPELVTAIVTEAGVLEPPFRRSIARVCREQAGSVRTVG